MDIGARVGIYGHGVDSCQNNFVTVQDCYIHDLPGAGIHLAGGNMYNLVQRNYISNVGFGINVGFSTGRL